jgi:hypothetical protein
MKGFEPSVQWSSLGTQSVPSDKSYTPTGVTLMAAMAYNKNKVKSPKTIYPNEPGTCLRSRWDVTAGTALAGRAVSLRSILAGCRVFARVRSCLRLLEPER